MDGLYYFLKQKLKFKINCINSHFISMLLFRTNKNIFVY